MKQQILAALNAAGIQTESMDESALLSAYNALITKPQAEALNAVNAKLAEFEAQARTAADAELNALAGQLAVNSALTADDLKKLGLDRLKALQANSAAAPILPATPAVKTASEFAAYSINSTLEA